MDRFRYYLHGGGLKKHPEGNFILLVDHKNEMKKYEEPGQECNRGHKNTLPVKLWDCPVCTELLREEIKRQEILIEEQTKWIKHWKAETEQLRKDLHSTVGGRSAAGLALVNQNLRLIKEKDWQLNQIIEYKVQLYFDSYGPGNEGRKIALEETEEEMKQALKDQE